MDKGDLKKFALETIAQCFKKCNSCNKKDELLSILNEYKNIIDIIKEQDILNANINTSIYNLIIHYVYSHFIRLIKETIKQIDNNGSSLFINHFEFFSNEKLVRLIKDIKE